MANKLIRSTSIALATGLTSAVSAQIRIVNYNMLDKPTSITNTDVATVFGAIATDTVNGIARRPDLMILQEQGSGTAANLATILNNTFGVTTYTSLDPSGQPSTDRQAYVYNSATLSLIGSPIAIATSTARPVLRAQFRPAGYTTSAASFYAYGGHWMATDPAGRLLQAQAMRTNANALPAGTNVLYAGDFNIDASSEASYQAITTGTGNGLGVDPLNAPGTWNNNGSFAYLHTQSTRTTSLPDGGAFGGVDDRFDFQIAGTDLMDGEGMSYIGPTAPGTATTRSYRSFGNAGNTFNLAINSPVNTSKPATVLNALHNLSDHLPVVADYQLPARMQVSLGTAGPAVIVGAAASVDVQVSNTAPATASLGGDELDYTVTPSGAITGNFTGSIRPTTPAATHSLAINTATPGNKSGSVAVTSNSQAVENGSFAGNLNYVVKAHATPSLDAAVQSVSRVIDLGIYARGSTIQPTSFSIFNLADASGFTAELRITDFQFTGDTGLRATVLSPAQFADSASYAIQLDTQSLTIRESQYLLFTADESLPGGIARDALSITLRARVARAGDANLDGSVDFADLLILAQNYDVASGAIWQTADFDRTGSVGFSDLLALSQNFDSARSIDPSHFAASFQADWMLARSMIPEPASMVGVLAMCVFGRRQRR